MFRIPSSIVGAVTGRPAPFRFVFPVITLLLGLIASSTEANDASRVEYSPLSIGAFSEFGMLQGGRFGTSSPFRDEWVDNFGAYLSQSAIVDDRWFIRVGLGGIFQFQKPEVINAEWGGTQYRNFFAGPTVADIEYDLIPESPRKWRVGMGLFPYKYNSDAANLGEYLFRTGPYPTYIMTGGYSFVNSTAVSLQGLKSRFQDGNLSIDVLLTTETVMPPLYDLSLAGVVKYRALDGLLDVGAGINFKRLVPIRPSKTTLRDAFHDNAYFKGPDGEYYSGNLAYYRSEADFYSGKLAESSGDPQDSAYYHQRRQEAQGRHDAIRAWTSPDSAQYIDPDYEYYTQAGVIVTAQAALDLKRLLPESSRLGPEDLRVYTEVAVLGVKNYPVFYENRRERMPVMLGLNLPTFGVLDLVAVQYEYFPSPHPNSFSESINTNGATPEFVAGNDDLLSYRDYRDRLSKDDHSWSILARKQLTRGLVFSAQAARDHARMVSHAFYAGPGLAPNAMFYTTDKHNWYWMVQLSLGI